MSQNIRISCLSFQYVLTFALVGRGALRHLRFFAYYGSKTATLRAAKFYIAFPTYNVHIP